MMKWVLKLFLSILCIATLSGVANAQPEPSQKELESVLRRFINWRFGTMSLYRVTNISDIKRAIKLGEEKKSGIKMDDAILNSIDTATRTIIERGVAGGASSTDIQKDISDAGLTPPDVKVFEAVFSFYKKKLEGGGEQSVENAYLVTTRPEKGQVPNTVIAMIVSYNPIDNLEKNLRSVGPSEIYTYDELKAIKLDTTFTSDNLYDLMVNILVQQNYTNRTLDAQGIGNPEWFATKVHGKTYSILTKEADLSNEDVQRIMRISDAQPDEYVLKQNELIISPDLISWKRYELPSWVDASGNLVPDSLTSANSGLPNVGIEMRYGLDNINYPSFASSRMAINAIWSSVKLGVILPTDGWASLAKDLYNIDRKLTYGGVGINGAFDFPLKVVPQSGVFHLDAGYVFGNAHSPSWLPKDNPNFDPNMTLNDSIVNSWNYRTYPVYSYLIRVNAQLHYTFGVAVDENYWLRFGVGATMYNVEYWKHYASLDLSNPDLPGFTIDYRKEKDETIGGISGKIEFMAKNIKTPFGASISYFDESLGGNAWLQIPIVANTFAIKLDAKGFFSAFKDKPHPWESASMFIGTARFVINF